MNLKESKNISYYNRLPLIFFLCCGVTVVIRTVQIFTFIDRETGFYNGSGILMAVLYLLLIIPSVLFAVSSFLSKDTAEITLRTEKDSLVSVVSCVLSLAFLYDAFSAFVGSFDSIGSASYGVSAFQSMMLSGTIPQFFQSVFALFSAVYFLIFAKGTIKGKGGASGHKLLAVAPVCWAGFRLIHRFVEQISYVRVSDLLLELVLLALLVMFFMAFAQLMSGVYVKNARWRIVGLGLPCALVSFTVNLPRLIYVLTSGTDELYAKYPFKVCDFVIAIFAVVLINKLISSKGKKADA